MLFESIDLAIRTVQVFDMLVLSDCGRIIFPLFGLWLVFTV